MCDAHTHDALAITSAGREAGFRMPEVPADISLQARAALARRLIRRGQLDPLTGLSYVVAPSPAVLAAEAELSAKQHYLRAYGERRREAA